VLARNGFCVQTHDSASEFLDRVDPDNTACVITDVCMPGMSGIELYQHLQKISPLLADKVVFITGDVMGTGTMTFLSKTKAPYVIKPFDASQLKAEMNRVLAGA